VSCLAYFLGSVIIQITSLMAWIRLSVLGQASKIVMGGVGDKEEKGK